MLADTMHPQGLRIGVHLMRGFPRLAPSTVTCRAGNEHRTTVLADPSRICPWNPDMYGVDMIKTGVRAYYDSVCAPLASWGVGFVEMDDTSPL